MIDPIIISLLARLLIPLLIFRWRFTGYITAVLADSWLDCILVNISGGSFGSSINYQVFDKWLDLYMITIMVIVSLKFAKLEKLTSITLYSIRAVGIILFEITKLQVVFVFFPDIFNFFYIFIVGVKKFWPKFKLTKKNFWIVIALVTIPKLVHEITLHFFGFDHILWNFWLKTRMIILK